MSEVLVKNADDAYALGLWCADSYWWSSSIGLSNVEPELILRFGAYLSSLLPLERLRMRIYKVPDRPVDDRVLELTTNVSVRPAHKMRQTAYHVYVNSRPLLRLFVRARSQLGSLPTSLVGPYIAGRFDGDGNFGNRIRIAYSRAEEAELDATLLSAAEISPTSVLYYSKANEYCVYIHEGQIDRFKKLIGPFSWKASLHPLETEMASLSGIPGSLIYERRNTPAPTDNRVMG